MSLIKVVPYVLWVTLGVPGAPEPRMYPRSRYFLVYLYIPGQQGGCAQIPSWMKTAIQQKSGLGRIIQGQTAPEPIPWQAHMRQGSPWSFSYFCGGTILDAKTILTAAHCYYGADLTAGNFFIAAGAVHVLDASAQTAFVESIILHESYNPGEPG